MILNISNNCDIVRFYSDWMINKFETGVFGIETENQNVAYELTPKNFELLVFQTKDPTHILPYYKKLKNMGFNMLFIITLNPYDDIEPNLNKKQAFESFCKLSQLCGREHIVWKYAPIIINDEYSTEYHIKKFNAICKKVMPYTNECICEFLEPCKPPMHLSLYASDINKTQKSMLLSKFFTITKKYNIQLFSKHLKNNITTLISRKIYEFCDIKVTEKIPILDMGLKNTCKGMCEYCYCGGNQFYKNTECVVNSPIMIGYVDTNKRHIKKKCLPIK